MFTPFPLLLAHEGSRGPREGVQTEACTLRRLHYERGKVFGDLLFDSKKSAHPFFVLKSEITSPSRLLTTNTTPADLSLDFALLADPLY